MDRAGGSAKGVARIPRLTGGGSGRAGVSRKRVETFPAGRRDLCAPRETGSRAHAGLGSEEDDDVKDPCAAWIAADLANPHKGTMRGGRKEPDEGSSPP